MRSILFVSLFMAASSTVALAAMSHKVHQPSTFNPKTFNSGAQFCHSKMNTLSDNPFCFPFYNTSSKHYLNITFYNDKYSVGVAPKNQVSFYNKKPRILVDVRNPATSNLIYHGFFEADFGLICSETMCSTWQ